MEKNKPVKKMTRGEKVCAFITRYIKNPEGDLRGQPMKLMPFQVDFIKSIYDNPLGTHTAILSLGRRNGKTALIAALLLAHIAGPEAIANSQTASGARSKAQAAVIFDLAVKMIQQSPELSQVIKVMPSGKKLLGLRKNVSYQALSAEGKTAHGLSLALCIIDEIGQVTGPTDDFVAALTSAQGSYTNPLLIAISTQAATEQDMLSIWISAQKNAPDPRVVCRVYEAPADCALDDKKAWAAANPGLGVFRSISDVEKQCKAAMEMPANEPAFRNLILNQICEMSSPFVASSVWKENGAECGPIDGKKVWGGLDLSSVNDLTSLELVADDGGVHSEFWLPADGLKEKSRKDRVPYDLWAKQGYLNTTPGRAIEYEFVAECLRGLFDRCDVQALGFDRYNMVHLRPWLVKAGFSEDELEKFVPFGQGTASMTPALRELEAKLLGRKLRHGNHPILEMCAKNATVVGDSGARKFDKRKQTRRIDGMVALAMAVGVMPQAVEDTDITQGFVEL